MSIKRIDIFSRARLVHEINRTKGGLLVDPAVRVITVHDTHTRPAFPAAQFPRHLVLCFDDVNPGWMTDRYYPSCLAATAADGKAVVEYAQKITADPAVKRVIVNCEAGISRSSAIATSIAEIFDIPNVKAYQGQIHPNSHVRKLIFHAARDAGLYSYPAGLTPVFDIDKELDIDVTHEDPFGRELVVL